MRILLSNDDGIDAPGLAALERHFQGIGEVWVVAPKHPQSAKSHALTMHKGIAIEQQGERRFAISGTPVDTVYVATHSLMGAKPDLVVSGINRGANIGQDVHYSGTVAAAREGVLQGIPALAVSLHVDFSDPIDGHHWDTAGRLARRVASEVLERGLPQDTILNLNVPDVPFSNVHGIRACALGKHHYEALVDRRDDLRGGSYCWLGGPHSDFGPDKNSEGHFVEDGWASLVPLTVQVTATEMIKALAEWNAVDSVQAK